MITGGLLKYIPVHGVTYAHKDSYAVVWAVRRALRSHEQIWSEPLISGGMPLHLALPRVSAAIELGRIAFGRGVFARWLHA